MTTFHAVAINHQLTIDTVNFQEKVHKKGKPKGTPAHMFDYYIVTHPCPSSCFKPYSIKYGTQKHLRYKKVAWGQEKQQLKGMIQEYAKN